MTNKIIDDYDIWYIPCVYCGYDTKKGTAKSNHCWKCGRPLQRDFSKRALKKEKEKT
jgi:predicted amidophosphoribosyltransferase